MAWLNKYSSNPFVRNVAVMFSGNGLALIVPFLFAPLITRLYTPAEFATLELFMKILTPLIIVGSFRFDLALLLDNEEDEAKNLLVLCFRILIIACLIACVIAFFQTEVSVFFNNEGLSTVLWLLPIALLFAGSYSILIRLAIRLKKFNLLAMNNIISTGGNHFSKYIFGLIGTGYLGLVLGQILGSFISVIGVFSNRTMRNWIGTKRKVTMPFGMLMRKYKEFPLYNGSHALYDELYAIVLFSVISIYYGEVELGLFGFAFRYLRIPVQVLGTSFAPVVTPRITELIGNKKPVRDLILKSELLFLAAGIVPFTILFFFGGEIFGFVFGDNWVKAGVYAGILAPWLLLNFAVSPVSILPTLINKQASFFIINLVMKLLVLVGIFYTATNEYDIQSTLILVSGVNFMLNLILLIWFLRIADSKIDS